MSVSCQLDYKLTVSRSLGWEYWVSSSLHSWYRPHSHELPGLLACPKKTEKVTIANGLNSASVIYLWLYKTACKTANSFYCLGDDFDCSATTLWVEKIQLCGTVRVVKTVHVHCIEISKPAVFTCASSFLCSALYGCPVAHLLLVM